ncbi:Transmembrane prolyl 4-hydroxylase [Exaiptasia diaphana]|nr:Transmembrane prolyl 4-hydroxylase [Exaiptasia diaphana]
MDDDIVKMFQQLQFDGYDDGTITRDEFEHLNINKLVVYLDYLKNKHPRYRARFSEQAWLPQNTKSDPALRQLHERVIKLTKLPRKLIQGGEALQVVRYGHDGHYHVHYDSMPFLDERTKALPCCHHAVPRPNGCRLCRFITILYYLNKVEQGGETAFLVADNVTFHHEELTKPNSKRPDDSFNLSVNCKRANLVVPPKKGTAIMWYNHFIDDESGLLGALDAYSLHGGCDVIKGEKWIANNWLTAPPPGREHLQSVYDIDF